MVVTTTTASSAGRLLDRLDPEQVAVVTATERCLVVQAAAGSGKTRALTRRVAYRCEIGAADPTHTLAVTFTRKAAGELRDRLNRLGVRTVAAGTFHSLAWAQMRHYWRTRGKDGPSEVLDRKARIIGPLLARAGFGKDVEPADLAAEIEWAKVRLLSPDRYVVEAQFRRIPMTPDQVAAIWKRYEEEKSRRGVLDFEDMLAAVVRSARDDLEWRAELRDRYRHVYVDEFQDTSPLGHAVLRAWIDRGDPDLTVVGDPAQAIFSFSGADSIYLERFEHNWTGARRLQLTANYRSRPPILSVANALLADGDVAGGRQAAPKLRAQREGGVLPDVRTFKDDREEAAGVARLLRQLAHGPEGWKPAAVLYRINSQSALIEAALTATNIPFRVRGDRAFLRRNEVRRALANARRDRGAATEGAPAVLAAISRGIESGGLDDDALANLGVLQSLAREYIEAGGSGPLAEFVEWLERTASGDESSSSEAVELLTLHRAKGLEWDVVVIVGFESGLLPFSLARGAGEREEERRLAYVGLTRARERLALTRAVYRTGLKGERQPSPYLEPIEGAIDALRRGADPGADWHAAFTLMRTAATAPPDAALIKRLKQWRRDRASSDGVPPYVVFHDSTLDDIARQKPRTPSQLLGIDGIGPVKRDRYGDEIIAIVRSAPAPR